MTMIIRARSLLNPTILVTLLAGCGSGGPQSEAVVRRDSAGISILEANFADTDGSRTLSSEPIVALGVVEGDSAQEFNGVRSALWLDDSLVAVVNGGTNEIRLFDRQGNHIRSVGGTGDGPGEYQGLSSIGRIGADTIFAFDRWLQRVTVLTASGGLTRTYQLPFEGASSVARLTDGSFIPVSFLVGMPRRPRGIHADTAAVLSYTIQDPAPDTLFAVTTLEWFSHGDDQPPTPLPWGRTTFIAAGDLIHAAQSDRFEVRSYRTDGRLLRIVRSSGPRMPVDGPAYEHMKERWLATQAASPGGRTDPTLRWADLPPPEYLPEVAGLQVEDNGRVWLEKYEPDATRERIWFGFENGTPAGTLRIPPGLRVMDISTGHVVVRRTDDLGVEYVDVYTVIES